MDTDAQYDPDAPVTHDHAGGIRHTHPHPGIDHAAADARPVLDPEPIPNIVLHPGDTLAPRGDTVRLLDRHGVCYAVLDGHRDDPHDPGFPGGTDADFVVDAIRFVADRPGGRGVLPVRPEPYQEPHTQPVPDPHGLTVFSITTHEHKHPHAEPDNALRVAYWHTHDHPHPGDYRPATARHVADVALHDHDHQRARAGGAGGAA